MCIYVLGVISAWTDLYFNSGTYYWQSKNEAVTIDIPWFAWSNVQPTKEAGEIRGSLDMYALFHDQLDEFQATPLCETNYVPVESSMYFVKNYFDTLIAYMSHVIILIYMQGYPF